MLSALLSLYVLADGLIGERVYAAANVVGPLALTVTLGTFTWRLLRKSGRTIWTSVAWFRLSTALYFGLGTLSLSVIDDETRTYLETFNKFTDRDVFRMNLAATFSTLLVLAAARAILVRTGKFQPVLSRVSECGDDQRDSALLACGIGFLLTGLMVTYGLKVPQDMGWTTGEWPGSIIGLWRLTMIGIFMLTLWSLQRSPGLVPVVAVLTSLEMTFQLLLFSKYAVMLTLVMFMLAFLWHKVSAIRLAICAGTAVVLFIALQPVVTYGRDQLALEDGRTIEASFATRWDVLSSYFTHGSMTAFVDASSGAGLGRINYVSAATLEMREYDLGRPGRWPEMIPVVFVPRFIWPQKPNVSDVGLDLYELVTGRRTSAVGAGLFADAYWAMGWLGITVFMTLYGLVIGVCTGLADKILTSREWIFFPVVLQMLLLGFRTDGSYIGDVAGGGVIALGTYLALRVIRRAIGILGKAPGRRVISAKSQAHR